MGRSFSVERGTFVTVCDGINLVTFSSFDDFKKYYSEIDLIGTKDLYYDPDMGIHVDSVLGIKETIIEPIKKYEAIIDKASELKENKENPYFTLTVTEAKEFKINVLKQQARFIITTKWPEWKQININYSGTDEEKAKKDSDIKKIVDACNEMEEEINKLRTVNQVSKYEIAYPSLD